MKSFAPSPPAALALLLVTATSPGQPALDFSLVALQGSPSPSISPTALYGILGGPPHLDATGHISFGGFVTNNGSANYAVWTGLPGATSALAVAGDPTPGRPGETLDVFTLSSASDYWPCSDGSVAFACDTADSSDHGVWRGTPGSINPVLIVNDPTPTLAGATVKGFPRPVFVANGEGAVLVRAAFEGGGATSTDDSGIWLTVSGQPAALVAREGDPAPGTEGGTSHDDFTFATLSMNAHGQLCFENGIRSGSPANNRAIFAGPVGALTPVVRKGGAIPIMPGFTWDRIDKPRINNRGDIAFEAVPQPGGNNSFFVRFADDTFAKIAEDNQPAPGAGGRNWSNIVFNQPLIAGSFSAFVGGLEESGTLGKDGIWVFEKGEGTSLVAKAGDPVPGMPGDTFSTFSAPALNALGMVAFQAITEQGGRGLWLYHHGVGQLLVAVGDFLSVGPDDSRRVSAIFFRGDSSSQSGYRSGLNDSGQLAFKTSFNTGALGTAIFHLDLCDLDGGGVDCVLEDAFGGDPGDGTDDYRILPAIRHEGGEIVLSYRRRTNGSYLYEVQDSTTLDGWGQADGSTVLASDQDGLPAGFERVEFRKPILAGSRLFLRVQVTPLPVVVEEAE